MMDTSLEDVMASWAQLEKDVGHSLDRLFGHIEPQATTSHESGSSSLDRVNPGDFGATSRYTCTPAAALKGSLSEDVVALSAMVVDQSCRSSTSPSSAWSKGDANSLMTAAGTNADDVPDAIVRVFKSTPRGIKKVRGRRTNRQRTDPVLADAAKQQAAVDAVPVPAAPVPPKQEKQQQEQKQEPEQDQGQQEEQQGDTQSLSGLLHPFAVIKDYGRGSKITLQQLNEKIKGSCKLV